MNLLLDTHIVLWAAFSSSRLPRPALDLISSDSSVLWFSVASLWEVTIKRGLNRPDFTVDPSVLRAGLLSNGYHELPIEGRHCLTLAAIPPLHGDPFDRMLLAQAMSEGMQLLTADQKLGAYDGPIRLV